MQHRFGPGRLFLLFILIFSVFFASSVLWSLQKKEIDSIQKSRELYQINYFVGEKFLSAYLKYKINDSQAWKILIGERNHQRKENPDPSMPGYTPSFLSEAELFALMDQSGQSSRLRTLYRTTKVQTGARFHPVGTTSDSLLLADAGDVLAIMDENIEALECYKKSNRLRPSDEVRRKILETQLSAELYTEFCAAMRDPAFFQTAGDELHYKFFLKEGQYQKMAFPLFRSQFQKYSWEYVLAAAVSGFGWLILCLHLGNAWRWKFREKLLILPALFLGAASTYVTILVVVIEENYFPYSRIKKTVIIDLLYFVLGVGLREETLKLLFAAALFPFLRKMEHLKIVILMSIVGLGFAIEENVLYYNMQGGIAVMGRFLTANFFHMTLTAFCGTSLFYAFKRSEWEIFFQTFGLMILLHGLYDFFLTQSDILGDASILAMIGYIWLSRQYFIMLREGGRLERPKFPLSAVFVIVLAVSAGIAQLMLAADYGPIPGFFRTVASSLGFILITVMFFREFGDA